MNKFRTWCSTLFGYDWVGIPLVYTQVGIVFFSPVFGLQIQQTIRVTMWMLSNQEKIHPMLRESES